MHKADRMYCQHIVSVSFVVFVVSNFAGPLISVSVSLRHGSLALDFHRTKHILVTSPHRPAAETQRSSRWRTSEDSSGQSSRWRTYEVSEPRSATLFSRERVLRFEFPEKFSRWLISERCSSVAMCYVWRPEFLAWARHARSVYSGQDRTG